MASTGISSKKDGSLQRASVEAPHHKRPRGDDASIRLLPSDWLSLDANDRICEIPPSLGNPRVARGAFGEISMAIDTAPHRSGWKLAVVKTLSQPTVPMGWGLNAPRKLSKEVLNEVLALRLLCPHDNIVPFVGLVSSQITGSLSLAFHYSPIDLYLVLNQRNTLLPWNVIKTMSRDILMALQHCHSHGILHRDISPRNLLVSRQGFIQLCDFGLAKPCPSLCASVYHAEDNSDASLSEQQHLLLDLQASGTKGLCALYYRPPEMLLGVPAHDPPVDIYSAGLVIAELLSGRVVFQGQGVLDQLGRVLKVLGTPTAEQAKHFPDSAKLRLVPQPPKPLSTILPRLLETPQSQEFLQHCIALDPSQRHSAKHLLRHDWWDVPPCLASRETVAHDLLLLHQKDLPEELLGPEVLFSMPISNNHDDTSSDASLRVAGACALKVAAAQRSYRKRHKSDDTLPLRSWDSVRACLGSRGLQ